MSELIVNLFPMDLAFKRSNTTFSFNDSASMLSTLMATVVSSANTGKSDISDNDGRSFIYTGNKRGPKILNSGSPIVVFF